MNRRAVLLGILAAPIVVRSGLVMPISTRASEWSKNELLAGLFDATRLCWYGDRRVSSEEFSAIFKVAALRERAHPQFIEHARRHFA